VTGIEIDPTVVDVGAKFFDLQKDEVTIVVGDAIKYVEDAPGSTTF